MRTSWNNKRTRRKKRIWNKRKRPGKKETKISTRRKPMRKTTKYWEVISCIQDIRLAKAFQPLGY